MRVLFVLPPQRVRNTPAVRDQPELSLPLGVLSMAARLLQREVPARLEIYDARLSARRRRLGDGSEWFGDPPAAIAARLRAARPDVVAISNMFSWQIEQAFEVARTARRVCPGATVVLGGPHASSFPAECAARPEIDYVVMGEGEDRLVELLLALGAGRVPEIQGVVAGPEDLARLRRSRRQPIGFIEPLDDLPLPAYHLVDTERYFALQRRGLAPRNRGAGTRTVSVLTSRGCPHQCVFCSIQTTMGYRFRHHSPEYVREHLDVLMGRYGVDYVHFEDDNLTHDPERYDAILSAIEALGRPLRWDTPNGIRGDTWDEARVRRSRALGCQFLIVAVESGVQRVLDDVVKKRLDLQKVDELMCACKAAGLPLYAYYVLGLPGETLEDIEATVDYAIDRYARYDVFPTFNLAIALPGTELHDSVLAHGWHRGPLTYRANEIVTADFDPPSVASIHGAALRRTARLSAAKAVTDPRQLGRFATLALRYRRQLVTFAAGRVRALAGLA